MTDAALADARPDEANLNDRGLSETPAERVSYLRAGHTLRSWLLTTDQSASPSSI
jgi:cytochrome c oxidase subunit I